MPNDVKYELLGWPNSGDIPQVLAESDEMISLADAVATYSDCYLALEVQSVSGPEPQDHLDNRPRHIHKGWCRDWAKDAAQARKEHTHD